jgi:hypothetical protein
MTCVMADLFGGHDSRLSSQVKSVLLASFLFRAEEYAKRFRTVGTVSPQGMRDKVMDLVATAFQRHLNITREEIFSSFSQLLKAAHREMNTVSLPVGVRQDPAALAIGKLAESINRLTSRVEVIQAAVADLRAAVSPAGVSPTKKLHRDVPPPARPMFDQAQALPQTRASDHHPPTTTPQVHHVDPLVIDSSFCTSLNVHSVLSKLIAHGVTTSLAVGKGSSSIEFTGATNEKQVRAKIKKAVTAMVGLDGALQAIALLENDRATPGSAEWTTWKSSVDQTAKGFAVKLKAAADKNRGIKFALAQAEKAQGAAKGANVRLSVEQFANAKPKKAADSLSSYADCFVLSKVRRRPTNQPILTFNGSTTNKRKGPPSTPDVDAGGHPKRPKISLTPGPAASSSKERNTLSEPSSVDAGDQPERPTTPLTSGPVASSSEEHKPPSELPSPTQRVSPRTTKATPAARLGE